MIFAPIPNSNLLLIVIDNSTQREEGKLDAEAKKIEYKDFVFPCHKRYLNNLDRRALEDCFVEDERVSAEAQLFFYNIWLQLLLNFYIFFFCFHRNIKMSSAIRVLCQIKLTTFYYYRRLFYQFS